MGDDPRNVNVGEPERTHPRGVDDPPRIVRQAQRDGRRRGMPPAPGHVVDPPDAAVGSRDEGVDEGRLADAGVSDEHRHPADQPGADLVEADEAAVGATRGDDARDREGCVVPEEVVRSHEVGLGEDKQGVQPRVVCRHQAPVDEPWPGRWVGERRHDDELVGVGDQDPLDRVDVVGAAAQNGAAWLDPHDSGQRVRMAGGVTDHPDVVADDDPLAAEFAGLHCDQGALVRLAAAHSGGHQHAISPPVDRDDGADESVPVGGTILGPRA